MEIGITGCVSQCLIVVEVFPVFIKTVANFRDAVRAGFVRAGFLRVNRCAENGGQEKNYCQRSVHFDRSYHLSCCLWRAKTVVKRYNRVTTLAVIVAALAKALTSTRSSTAPRKQGIPAHLV